MVCQLQIIQEPAITVCTYLLTDLQIWKITKNDNLKNKELGQDWIYGNDKWELLPDDHGYFYLAKQNPTNQEGKYYFT